MKTGFSISAIYRKSRIVIVLACFTVLFSCVSTKVMTNYHCDTFANNPHYRASSWSYFWGLKQKEIYVGPDCANCTYGVCREGTLNGVEVQTSFGGAFLSVVTLGIVNHRYVKWCCSRPDGDGGLDD